MFKKNNRHTIPLERYQRKVFGKLDDNKPICVIESNYLNNQFKLAMVKELSKKYNILIKSHFSLTDPNYFSNIKHQVNVLEENNLLFFKGIITEYMNIFGSLSDDGCYKLVYVREKDFGYDIFIEGDKDNE